MANSILTPTAVTREALRILHNNIVFTKGVNRQYDDQFAKEGGKIGNTLKVRKPNQFTVRSGSTLAAQDLAETSLDVVVATQIGVDVNFTSVELTLDLDDFSERILQPAMARLASEIDYLGLTEIYQNTFNQVGTPGTTPATAKVWLDAAAKLSDYAAPEDEARMACMNPSAQASTVDALKGLFQSSTEIASQYKRGKMGTGLGLNFGMSQNINRHTVGTGSGYLVNGASQTGNSLIVDTGTGTLKQGDIFTIAGVNGVNPETKRDLGTLQQFVVTADYAGGAGTISISPALTATGAYQTISAAPADNAAITIAGTASTAYPINIVHHRDAITLVTADLEDVSKHGAWGARETYEGISMRIARQYDITNDKFPCRIDILLGWKMLRDEYSCRVIG